MDASKFINRTDENWSNYKKQGNFFVNLLMKTEKAIFQQFKH